MSCDFASTTQGRSARILAGLGANGVTQVSQLLMRLVEVPILLMAWGAAGYGEWLLIAALPMALTFSDGGFTKTARREMTMRASRGEGSGVAAIFQSAWVLLLALSALVLTLLGVILPHLPLVQLLKLKSIDSGELVLALFALATQVLVYFQCGLVHGALTSRGRYAAGELMIALTSVLSFMGVLTGATTHQGILGAAVGSMAGQFLGYIAMLFIFYRQTSSPRYGLQHASRKEIKALWAPSVANLVFPMADALNVQGVRLVVGLTLGPAALAVFSTTRTLCRTAVQPILAIARTLEPELSLAYGSKRDIDARDMYMRASHIGLWLSLGACLCVIAVAPWLYHFWVGRHLHLDMLAMILMLLASVLNLIWGIALTVPCSTNRHASIALRFLGLYGVGSIALTWIFAKNGGVSGAAAGMLIVDLVAAILLVNNAIQICQVGIEHYRGAVLKSPVGLVRAAFPVMRAFLPKRRSISPPIEGRSR